MTVLLAFAGGVALAQDRAPQPTDQRLSQNRSRQRGTKPADPDRQVRSGWYTEQPNHDPVGLRDWNSVLRNVEPRLEIASALNEVLRTKVYPEPPIDLWHRETPPPRSYQFVAIAGGHVVGD